MGLTLRDLSWPPTITTTTTTHTNPHPNHHHPSLLSEFMHMCKNTHRYTLFQTKWTELLMSIFLMHLLSYTSQTGSVRMSLCVTVCVCYFLRVFQNPPLPHHHRKHVLSPSTFIINPICCFSPLSVSLISFSQRPRTDKHTNRFWCETVDQTSF